MKIKDMILVALFVALIAVGAYIKIPIPYVPLTLQIMFTNLAALILGARLGSLSSLLYVVIGLIGFPIFTEGGGPSYIFKPSFGYLIAFPIGAYICGVIVNRMKEKNIKAYLLGSFANLVVVYTMGFLYGIFIMNVYLGKGTAISTLFSLFILAPLPGDIITLGISSMFVNRIKKAIKI